jgi:DNA-binding transcriptional LysR family regulator
MDRLEAMSILVASVEEGSFSAAGRKLGVPLPTISRKVADLEAHLKTRPASLTSRHASVFWRILTPLKRRPPANTACRAAS